MEFIYFDVTWTTEMKNVLTRLSKFERVIKLFHKDDVKSEYGGNGIYRVNVHPRIKKIFIEILEIADINEIPEKIVYSYYLKRQKLKGFLWFDDENLEDAPAAPASTLPQAACVVPCTNRLTPEAPCTNRLTGTTETTHATHATHVFAKGVAVDKACTFCGSVAVGNAKTVIWKKLKRC